MKITMIGTGYVGLVTGTCFADSGNDVTCLDVDQKKIATLNSGEIPIYEPGLEEMVHRNLASGRLHFTCDYAQAIPGSRCIFICVGTPQDEQGAADLQYVRGAVQQLAPYLDQNAVVICKSTVPVGTNRRVRDWIEAETSTLLLNASNPEFLKEGTAIADFMHPDRVVVGVDDERAANVLEELYRPFLHATRPLLTMGIEIAEMVKYAANCLLATKISFINEMANICEAVDADINEVRFGMGHDARIGFSFFYPGAGYGGSCFPKDVRALSSLANQFGVEDRILEAVDETNRRQKRKLFKKIFGYFSASLIGKTIAVWGLAFKPGTDDIREAPSLVLIEDLLRSGARVKVTDPVAMPNVRKIFGDEIEYSDDLYETCRDADALAIVTEWNEFQSPDFERLKSALKTAAIFDGRNLFDAQKMAERGFYYSGIGLRNFSPANPAKQCETLNRS